MIEHTLIGRLKYAVNVLGLSQQDISAATGIHQSQISRILSGKVRRISKNLQKLSSYLENLHELNAKQDAIPQVLADAIRFSWDGTLQHADALARVIVSLKGLRELMNCPSGGTKNV